MAKVKKVKSQVGEVPEQIHNKAALKLIEQEGMKQAKELWGQYYNDVVFELVKQEKIPVAGITFLGNKPYINQTGLDRKVKDKKERTSGIKMSIWTELITRLPIQPHYNSICRVRAHIEFFDSEFLAKMLDKITKTKQPVTIEVLDRLRKISTEHYSCEGSGSAFDIGIGFSTKGDLSILKDAIVNRDKEAIKKIEDRIDWDVVEMTTETRALSRSKRQAVGTGFTSIMEMPFRTEEEEEESKYDYSQVRSYLQDPKLSTEQKNIIEQGITKGKHPDKIFKWIKNILEALPDSDEGEAKETIAAVSTILEETKEQEIKFKGSDKQNKKLKQILQSSVLTEQEREGLEDKAIYNISDAIGIGLQKIERRKELMAFFSEYTAEPFPKIDPDILLYMTEMNINAQHRMIEIIESNLDKNKNLPEEKEFNLIIRKELKIGGKIEAQN